MTIIGVRGPGFGYRLHPTRRLNFIGQTRYRGIRPADQGFNIGATDFSLS